MSDLGAELAAVAQFLEVPDPGEVLRHRVIEHVRAAPAPVVRRRRRRIVAVIAAAIAGIVAVPVAPAVADWLGVGGVEVISVPDDPTDATLPPTFDDQLGRKVTARQAASAVGRRIVRSDVLGAPAAVWLDERGATPMVTLDYGDLLITQFLAPLESRDVIASKFAGPDVLVEQVDVDGAPGLWLEGAHGIALREPGGGTAYVAMRLSANALVFERDGMTFRIETEGTKEEALKVARSLR